MSPPSAHPDPMASMPPCGQGEAEYLIIGRRRFLLVEVDEASDERYFVTDPEEAALVREALRDTSARLSPEGAREYLKARLREHGIG